MKNCNARTNTSNSIYSKGDSKGERRYHVIYVRNNNLDMKYINERKRVETFSYLSFLKIFDFLMKLQNNFRVQKPLII